MRFRTGFLLALTLLAAACHRGVSPRATEEEPAKLSSVVLANDPRAAGQLTKGFYAIEQGSWRWTMGSFAVRLRPPRGASERGAILLVKFSVPEPVLSRMKTVTLQAKVNGQPLAPQTYTATGDQVYRREIPASAFKGDAVNVEFTLDHFLASGVVESRELGIIAQMVGLEKQ